MRKINILFTPILILCLRSISFGAFIDSKNLAISSLPTKSYGFDSTKTYNSLKGIIGTNFYKENNRGVFNNLCVQDCLSFTFLLHANGEINIQEFSIYTPLEIKRLIERSIAELNSLPLSDKTFVNDWVINKYDTQLIMQPILLNLFSESCAHPKDLKYRGMLSLLTKKQDSGKVSKNSTMTPSGEFDAPPFSGILLSSFVLKSPFIRVGR